MLPSLPGGLYASANAINNEGQVVGTSNTNASRGAQAVRWEADGSIHALSEVPADSHAFGMNELGDVVGKMYGIPSISYESGFLWRESSGAHGMGDNGSAAWGSDVNASGMAVGTRLTSEQQPDFRAFVWDETGGMRDVPLPPSERTFGSAINDRGQVVGGAQNDAFVWDPVVGLILLQTGGWGEALDINEAGVVVGDGALGPFIWDAAHGARSLNDLVPTPFTADHVAAIRINNVGQILVAAESYAGNPEPSRYYLLTPIPSPGVWMALVCWGAVLRPRSRKSVA
jgi:probable HAF family extracellular repeat protein